MRRRVDEPLLRSKMAARPCRFSRSAPGDAAACTLAARVPDPVRDALLRGLDLFNRRAFFAAHEAWEVGWQRTADPTRRLLLQGLIQVAAAGHKLHAQHRPTSAARLLARGLAKLDRCPPDADGLELAGFREATRARLAALARDGLPVELPPLARPSGGDAEPPFLYQPFYCEENVIHLCAHPRLAGREPAAVFIRGAAGECVMWHQRAAAGPGEPVLWDYHVVLLARGPWEVWDLDSTLGCPVPAQDYLRRSFRPELALPPRHAPRLRVVPAPELAARFASDRSHMRGPNGEYSQPPPPWPAIGPAGAPSTLARFLALGDPIAGEEMDLPALLERVRGP